MRFHPVLSAIGLFLAACSLSLSGAGAKEPIRLATGPALSPDGATLVFSWVGDLWSVPSGGGKATPLTRNPAAERTPEFSPDGKKLAFTSDRTGSALPYVMPAEGGEPKQVGFHSSGYAVEGWSPDGNSGSSGGSVPGVEERRTC